MFISKESQDLITKVSNLSSDDTQHVFYKMVEEMGEVAMARNQPHRCTESDVREVVDLIICCFDYLNKVGVEDLEIYDIINEKAHKWLGQIRG